jgi:predicted nucleotidyltransferase
LVSSFIKIKSLKLISFLALPENEQYRILFEKGAVVAERLEKPVIKKLYSLHTFFVEVHFHYGTEEILFKKVFKAGELLDNYLNDFKIPKST